ncbi:hypothetical protein [Streptococcus danieliae]|uniref:Uncharacterized protein n=1 Tax=Streptococcus danieliae TaxID=747656 RepID=A0A7Z0M6K5_9STRE|nr:hypothetical protein [Streptococcus danieliae]MBF0699572.1 hypothetical protein [Streptococcus danieliae]NYS96748.1 hypothetical protein [Streptococcus danieliae]
MKKFLITLISLVLLFKIGFEIHHNLVYYSVYYAQHLNHNKDADPVMALLIDNLDAIPRPENSTIGYDFDGINIAYHNYKNIQVGGLISSYDLYNNRNVYSFDTSGKFYEYTMMGSEIPYNFKEKQEEAKKLVYDIIQPVIDIQPEPPKYANLQWIFNIIYGRRFQ